MHTCRYKKAFSKTKKRLREQLKENRILMNAYNDLTAQFITYRQTMMARSTRTTLLYRDAFDQMKEKITTSAYYDIIAVLLSSIICFIAGWWIGPLLKSTLL